MNYTWKIRELNRKGIEVRELGGEIAIASGKFIYIGGDTPTCFELAGVTDEQARKLAKLGRTVGNISEYGNYIIEIGAREIPWNKAYKETKEKGE